MAGVAGAASIVDHDKERRLHDPQSASGPAARRDACRGRRRGFDGPTLPMPFQFTDAEFVPTAKPSPASGGCVPPVLTSVRPLRMGACART